MTLSQIRMASEELLETMDHLQEDIKGLTLDLQNCHNQLATATATITWLQEQTPHPVKATTGHSYHRAQFEARRDSGCCTRCGGTGHFRAA